MCNGVQESGADPAAVSATADAALGLCALAPSLLRTGTKPQAFIKDACTCFLLFPPPPPNSLSSIHQQPCDSLL